MTNLEKRICALEQAGKDSAAYAGAAFLTPAEWEALDTAQQVAPDGGVGNEFGVVVIGPTMTEAEWLEAAKVQQVGLVLDMLQRI